MVRKVIVILCFSAIPINIPISPTERSPEVE